MAASGRQAGSGPTPTRRGRRLGPPAALCIITLALVCLLSSTGQGPVSAPISGIIAAVATGLQAGLFALAYVLGAIGLGRLPAALLSRQLPSRLWIQAALGVALMLWLSHLLGCFGLLSGDGLLPRVVAWGVVAAGLVLLADQLFRGDLAPERWPTLPWTALLAAPALAVLFVAAANPPGWLWQSEFGAYDALSYHLQLPKEWAAGNRLAPVDHNVYSYLPGYVEAAYLHLAQMMAAGGGGDAQSGNGVIGRMLGGEGIWVYSCQLLHALLGVLAAALCGRSAWAVARGAGANGSVPQLAAILATCLVLSTGWAVVCASLAYNEMGVLLCADRPQNSIKASSASALLRAAGIGFLVGIASSCKPTALLLIGPAAGIVMLAMVPRREWPRAVIAGSVGGLIAIAPWLVRNALAAGNPVFPFAAELLGTGNWTAEQAARYARAHASDGSVFERIALLFSSRGWLNAQWGVTPWVVLGAAAIAITHAHTRRIALLLIGGIACAVIAWLFATHQQSRFLLPLLAPMAMLLGLGIAAIDSTRAPAKPPPSRFRTAMLLRGSVLLAFLLSLHPAVLFYTQRAGTPNALLVGGVAAFTGSMRSGSVYADLTPEQSAATLRQAAGPHELVNLAINPATLGPKTRASMLGLEYDLPASEPDAVYLFGDATPLYYLGATGGDKTGGAGAAAGAGVIYHTTWDRSPLGDAIRAALRGRDGADDPGAWTDALRARGIGFVLVNMSELNRLIDRDHNFDPDVTTALVDRWLTDPASRLRIVRAWVFPGGELAGNNAGSPGEAGLVLVRLMGAAEASGQGTP